MSVPLVGSYRYVVEEDPRVNSMQLEGEARKKCICTAIIFVLAELTIAINNRAVYQLTDLQGATEKTGANGLVLSLFLAGMMIGTVNAVLFFSSMVCPIEEYTWKEGGEAFRKFFIVGLIGFAGMLCGTAAYSYLPSSTIALMGPIAIALQFLIRVLRRKRAARPSQVVCVLVVFAGSLCMILVPAAVYGDLAAPDNVVGFILLLASITLGNADAIASECLLKESGLKVSALFMANNAYIAIYSTVLIIATGAGAGGASIVALVPSAGALGAIIGLLIVNCFAIYFMLNMRYVLQQVANTTTVNILQTTTQLPLWCIETLLALTVGQLVAGFGRYPDKQSLLELPFMVLVLLAVFGVFDLYPCCAPAGADPAGNREGSEESVPINVAMAMRDVSESSLSGLELEVEALELERNKDGSFMVK